MLRALVWLGLVLLLSGCAIAPAAPTAPDLTRGGALVFSVRINHAVKPDYQPTILRVILPPSPLPRTAAAFGEDPTTPYRTSVAPMQRAAATGSTFLVVLSLAPGTYALTDLGGATTAFPISGAFTLPVMGTWTVTAGQLLYAGRVEAVSRARHGDEPRAGPLFPLADQGISGYAHATWDVTVQDQSAEDLSMLRQQIPTWPATTPVTALIRLQESATRGAVPPSSAPAAPAGSAPAITPAASPPPSRTADRLKELDALRQQGLITESEYQAARKRILEGL